MQYHAKHCLSGRFFARLFAIACITYRIAIGCEDQHFIAFFKFAIEHFVWMETIEIKFSHQIQKDHIKSK